MSKWRLFFIKHWIIKRRLNRIFPTTKKLIIVNSSLSYKTELALKKTKFPYTITYGTVETMGLASYSDPSKFEFGSVGKPIMSILSCNNDDILKVRGNNLHFFHRRGEEINSEYGFMISKSIEKILQGLPYVIDCILGTKDKLIYLIVSVDMNTCDYYNITRQELQELLNKSLKKINDKVYKQEKIHKVVILYDDFKRDSYDRIIQKYYQLE